MSFHMHNMYNMHLNSICKICIIKCNIICIICHIICIICRMSICKIICRLICRICWQYAGMSCIDSNMQNMSKICIICYVDFQYAQYAFPTLLMIYSIRISLKGSNLEEIFSVEKFYGKYLVYRWHILGINCVLFNF